MKLALCSFLFALLVTFAATDTVDIFDHEDGVKSISFPESFDADPLSHGRELIVGDLCGNVLTGILGVPFRLLNRNFTCSCGFDLIPPSLSAGCGNGRTVCFVPPDIVCGTPELGLSLDFLSILQASFPFSAEICYNNLVIAGTLDLSNIPLCLGIDAGLLETLGGLFGANSLNNETSSLPEPVDNDCAATMGSESCTSCSVCSDMTVSFNCTNIHPAVIGTCVDVGVIPFSFQDLLRVEDVSLNLDSYPSL